MRDRLCNLLCEFYGADSIYSMYYEFHAEELVEFLLANGVIVPPVKLGQTVWCIGTKCRSGLYDMPCKRAVSSECFDCPLLTELCVFEREVNNWSWFYLTLEKGEDLTWGKTIFLTKEEAERALAEREGSHE